MAVKKAINSASKLNSKVGATHVIFFDKNHPNTGGVSKALKDVHDSVMSKSVTVKKLFLVPELASES